MNSTVMTQDRLNELREELLIVCETIHQRERIEEILDKYSAD